jgi:hypothetical protein
MTGMRFMQLCCSAQKRPRAVGFRTFRAMWADFCFAFVLVVKKTCRAGISEVRVIGFDPGFRRIGWGESDGASWMPRKGGRR